MALPMPAPCIGLLLGWGCVVGCVSSFSVLLCYDGSSGRFRHGVGYAACLVRCMVPQFDGTVLSVDL